MKGLLLSLMAAVLLCSALLGAASNLHVVKTYRLGGEGGWDYLTIDPASRHLFISRATHVMVIDADTGKSAGDIPETPGVHGIALAPELDRGFTSNGREGSVTIFDLKNLSVLSKVQGVGENPDAILYDPASKRVFTFNGRSHDATAIDAEKGQIVGKIPLEGRPEFAVSDRAGKLFVNLEDQGALSELNPRELKVEARWPLRPCESPSGLAIDAENRRLFVGCGNKMMAVVDAESGKVITTLPIGEGVDANGFDPERKLAFASCGDGTLTVASEQSPERFTVAEQVNTAPGARTMALDPKTHQVFLVTAKFGPRPTGEAGARPPILPDTFEVLVVGK
jgi:DNA-binding beta-propeller fold protein YncE